jgi:hypothetical protein
MGTTIYIQSKIDGKQYCKTNGQFTRHLKQHYLTYQQYYEKYITGIERKCACGEPLTFYQSSETYANSCGIPECVGNSISAVKQNWTMEQKQRDSINKAAAHAKKTPKEKQFRKENLIKTNQKKYGVDFTTQSAQMMSKSQETKKNRYGNEFYSNPKKTSESWQSKTAEEIDIISDKKRITCIKKYGVENPFFLPDVRKKSAIANSIGKEYILPSGKIIHVRGHEDLVITELLKTYKESELVVDDMLVRNAIPIISYSDNRKHKLKYYPDIYIPHENKLIEVKSRWWWDGKGDVKYVNRLSKNLNKIKAVLEAGYKYEVWLFEDKNTYRILKDGTDFTS